MKAKMNRQHYWAVKPTNAADVVIRIEHAWDPGEAIKRAFGMALYHKSHPLSKYDKGKWLVKDLGTRVSVIQSDAKRIALLTSKEGWVDPTDSDV